MGDFKEYQTSDFMWLEEIAQTDALGQDFPEAMIAKVTLVGASGGFKRAVENHRTRPKGYWRQRNGQLISMTAMSLQHLANTLRMLGSHPHFSYLPRAGIYQELQTEWCSRGLEDQEWEKEYFSPEVYDKMLEAREAEKNK